MPGPQVPELQNALDALKSESQRCFCGFAKALELLRDDTWDLGYLFFDSWFADGSDETSLQWNECKEHMWSCR